MAARVRHMPSAIGILAILLFASAARAQTADDDAADGGGSIAILEIAADAGNIVLTLSADTVDVVFRVTRLKGGTVWTVAESTTPAAFDTEETEDGLVFDVVDPCPPAGQLTYRLQRRIGEVWETVGEQSFSLAEAMACEGSTGEDAGGGCSVANANDRRPTGFFALFAVAAALAWVLRRARP